jgi:hypothetical protein
MKRMKRFLAFAVMMILVLTGTHVAAQSNDQPLMTETHIERIRGFCVEAQTTLGQLHASDALLRVNRGRLYESISTKLMTPLNSRIALNSLDSLNLPGIASRYDQELAAFRQNYQQYEEAMTRTLRIDCTKQPVAFYDSVAETRDKRQKTHDNVVKLNETIQEYKAEFEVFAQKFRGEQ